MGSIRKSGRVIRIGCMLLVLGAVLLAAGCGKDGKIYGSVDWYASLTYSDFGGFPSSGSRNTYYEIKQGTYNVCWQLYDGSYYYPDISHYWIAEYTVEADKGSIPMVDGKHHYFDLYFDLYSVYKSGDVKSASAAAARSWVQDGLRVTVTEPRLVPVQDLASHPGSQFK